MPYYWLPHRYCVPCCCRDLEFAYSLSLDKAATDPVEWSAAFAPGTVVDGAVHEIKDYGLVCDLAAHEDVVGLVTTEHGGEGTHAEGRWECMVSGTKVKMPGKLWMQEHYTALVVNSL